MSKFRTYEVAAGLMSDYKAKYPRPESLNIAKGATMIIEKSFKPSKSVTKVDTVLTQSVQSMEVV